MTEGATNEAIGRRLFISAKTVSVHVTHILRSSRSTIARPQPTRPAVAEWSRCGPPVHPARRGTCRVGTSPDARRTTGAHADDRNDGWTDHANLRAGPV